MLISDLSFATAGGTFPLGGLLSLSTECGLNFKVLQFATYTVWLKWSLIAHWRMHDIKCLQTWSNHVLSLLEIVCSGICIYHHVEQNWSSCHTSEMCPIFIWSCQLYKCGRLYVFYWYICLLPFASWKFLLSLHCKNALKSKQGSQHQGGELKGFSVTILPSVFWDEYLWSCSIFS